MANDTTPMDEPVGMRPGEELDLDRLVPFLRDKVDGLTGVPEVRQFSSGYSNLTYLLRFADRDLVLRRPPFGRTPKTGHDMRREHTVLHALRDVYPYCPRPLAFSDDRSILGAPFFVMERIPGIIVHGDLPAGLDLDPAGVAALFDRVIAVHAELHAVDYRAVGLAAFGKPEGYAARQIAGWSERFRQARTPDVPDFEEVMAWLGSHLPPESGRAAVVHNDFRLDNVVLDPADPQHIVGVLDWEMATIGDPLMDLGASLAYWVERDDPPQLQALRLMPTHLEGAPTRTEVVAQYARCSGLDPGPFGFYLCYGLFRLAGITQQIYYRSYHGQTKDPRFRSLGLVVGALERAAQRVITGGGL
jgi:aminoglycoside phosphotransferase (APT) family kinase protein